MFRRTRILQAMLLALLTTACAGTPTSEISQPDTVKTTPGNDQSKVNNPSAPPAPSAAQLAAPRSIPEIQAGRSEATSRSFTRADGSLEPDIEAFAQEVAQVRALPPDHVRSLLKDAQYNATAAKLMAPSKTRIRRSWVTYKNRFVEPIRIRHGEQFWQENALALQRTEESWGVPASIIVAIIGVETIYGRYTGDFRVLDALATLGFRYPDPNRPERSHMFRNQLADLIQLDYTGQLNARQATGSFAGAMGLPQFMPGSLMRYAADGDRDGAIDLHGSTRDAIVSVARFLRLHGWVPGIPVFAPVTPPANAEQFVTGGLEPTVSWPELAAAGARVNHTAGQEAWQNQPLGVVNLVDEPRNTVEYRVGTPNFFALTHYNRSYFYASSVADLAQELERRMAGIRTTTAQLKTPVDK